nr:MAG TPA: hypothetical protein [Caudoviricetes sp.]
MQDGNMKKVIIIDDIRSHFIKQAIFILKDDFAAEDSHFILDEAYGVINKYIDSKHNGRSHAKKRRFFGKIFRRRTV